MTSDETNQKLFNLISSGVHDSSDYQALNGKLVSVTELSGSIVDKLKDYNPLNTLLTEQFEYLIAHAEFVEYEDEALIFSIGEQDQFHYFLLKGCVQLVAQDGKAVEITLNSKSSLSEIAKIKPRLYTASSSKKSILMRVDKELLTLCINNSDNQSNDINESSSNDTLPLSKLISMFFEKQPDIPVKKGKLIFSEGISGDYFYLIRKGKCQVIKYDEASQKNKVIALIDAKQYFGEESLILGKKRNATIRMATDGILARINQEQLCSVLSSIPAISYNQFDMHIEQGVDSIDVRDLKEIKNNTIKNSTHIPMYRLRSEMLKLNKNQPYIVFCDTGNRSIVAAFIMILSGIKDVSVLKDGLNHNEDSEEQYTFDNIY
ncbi:MAG: cyclic nucleotide-binding domain-containing protein [Gammaproteobacteria bacterium]|nr:cyclic nucleotide-binding domain-containing protein [Gammaproteobacteria bacterium]